MASSWAHAPRRRRRLGWLLLAILLGGAALPSAFSSDPVGAHALLVRADPPINATLKDPPTELTLYFSESLEHRFSNAMVTDQNNARVDDSQRFDTDDDTVIHVKLKEVGPGYLTVLWENVSTVDGHRITGSYPLTILNPDGSQPPGQPTAAAASTSGAEAKPGRVTVKWLLLSAGSLLTGAFAFLAFVAPAFPGEPGARARRAIGKQGLLLAALALIILVPGGLAELALQASNINTSIGDALKTKWGQRWILRNALLVLPLLALLLGSVAPKQRALLSAFGLLGAVAYLGVTSSVSHSAAGGGAFWATTFDFMHLLAASVWIGMLAMLITLFLWSRNGLARGERYGVLAAGLQRFSAIALVSVALVLFTGVLNTIIEVGRVGDLLSTGYGQALLIKLLLILPLLAVGAANAYVFRPDLIELVETRQRDRIDVLAEVEADLFKTVRWELGLALAVLAIVAVLVQLNPTRGKLSTPPQTGKFVESQDAGGISATLVIDPNQPGINAFEVYLTGATYTVETVRLNFSQEKGGNPESRLIMDATNPPTYYVGQGPYLPQAGNWTVGVDIRRQSGNDLLMPFKVTVNGGAVAMSSSRKGGEFSFPVSLSLASGALLAVSGVMALGLIAGSQRRAGLPAGYVGVAVEELAARVPTGRMRHVLSLGVLVAIGIGVGLVLGGRGHPRLSEQQATQGNPVPTSAESIGRGEILFARNCTQCHGVSGTGDGPLAETLPLPPANLYLHIPYHPDQFFFSVISNGLEGVMPAFGNQISEEDRWNILNYLRDRFSQPSP